MIWNSACRRAINVFIGANNVGKSNILSAMEYLLGPSYPTANRLERWDFYQGDEELPLKIALDFDDGAHLSFDSTWHDGYGREKHGLNYNGSYISDEVRSRYISASIGPDRRVLDNRRPANGACWAGCSRNSTNVLARRRSRRRWAYGHQSRMR